MRKIILFFLLFSKVAFSQESNDKIIYLDSLGNESSELSYTHYRIIKDFFLEKPSYKIEEYYKTGSLKKEGVSSTKNKIIYDDTWTFYFENSNKKEVIFFKNGRPSGATEKWYVNGSKKLVGEYIQDEKELTYDLKIYQFWDTKNNQTVVNGTGTFNEIEPLHNSMGKVKDGWKEGEWKGQDLNLKISYTEYYQNGKLTSGKSIDSSNVEYEYKALFIPPKPKKGLEHFYKYIEKNFRIPKSFGNNSGKIIVQFSIEKDGRITDIKILKGDNESANNEAIRLINKYPDWGIGEFRGIKVKTSYSIPITIEAAEDE